VQAKATMKPDYATAGWSTPATVVAIAEHSLRGEIALRKGDAAGAVTHFQAAAEAEDGLLYIEPPDWYYPVRHSLGLALLKANRPDEAEAVYLQDLKRFPSNGWALFGLAQAVEAQGKDASEIKQQFAAAWKSADVTLVASRF
jgi:tetratricopeptide (TPR) repeat protein